MIDDNDDDDDDAEEEDNDDDDDDDNDGISISSAVNKSFLVPRIMRMEDGEEFLFPWNSKFVKSLANEQYKKCKVFVSGMEFESESGNETMQVTITNSTTNMTGAESTTDSKLLNDKEGNKDETEIFPNEKKFYDECVPMQQWQTTFYPTCNLMHEVDLTSWPHLSRLNSTHFRLVEEETRATFLNARGSWRMAWKISPRSHHLANVEAGGSLNHVGVENSIPDMKEKRLKRLDGRESHAAVLKMLRLDRSYDAHSFANHQLDAMAMERLTSSPYVLDVYNFCGQSTMAEYATGDIRAFLKNSLLGSPDRFHIARNLVRGLSHIHGIDSHLGTNVTLAHNDINLANIVRVRHTSLKYHDFNIGVPLRWDPIQNRPCGFPVRYASPLWRSPEEIRNSTYVSEKVDIYSFGNMLFQIMTKHQPWTHLEPLGPDGNLLSMEEIQEQKLGGRLPHVPKKYTDSTNWRIQALYIAMRLCYDADPSQRPSAFELSIAFDRMWNALRRSKNATVQEVSDILNNFRIRLHRR